MFTHKNKPLAGVTAAAAGLAIALEGACSNELDRSPAGAESRPSLATARSQPASAQMPAKSRPAAPKKGESPPNVCDLIPQSVAEEIAGLKLPVTIDSPVTTSADGLSRGCQRAARDQVGGEVVVTVHYNTATGSASESLANVGSAVPGLGDEAVVLAAGDIGGGQLIFRYVYGVSNSIDVHVILTGSGKSDPSNRLLRLAQEVDRNLRR